MSLLSELSKTIGTFNEVITTGVQGEVVVNVSSFVYNFGTDTTAGAIGTQQLLVYPPIPAHSIVTNFVTNCTTALTGGSATVAITLATTGDLHSASVVSSSPFTVGATSTLFATCITNPVDSNNIDSVNWTIAVAPLQTGVFTGYISWYGL